MLFNLVEFLIFLPIIFLLYWLVLNKNLRAQNCLILGASYFFYGWWDWRFLSLILLSTLTDFLVGIKLATTTPSKYRKTLLYVSITINIGILFTFKYFNFFLGNIIDTISLFGQPIRFNSLHIILPLGISFYTFQTMSYTIDVYRGKIAPTKDFIAFASFVSFFPQLVAGPIERAAHLLPQFTKARKFSNTQALDGVKQIIWGFFKKMVIADSAAVLVNQVFEQPEAYSGSTLLLGAIFFSFQIYGDFSGYADMAIGTAKLFGINLMQNFSYPYFSRDMAEFWRRWHISLSTWFRDYVYIPLGGSRAPMSKTIRNVFIVFIVSGLWHGANWTFLIWGLLHALYFIPLLIRGRNRTHLNIVAPDKILPNLKEVLQMVSTFLLTTLAWVFFRAESALHAWEYLSGIFSLTLFDIPEWGNTSTILLILFFIIVEWIGRKEPYALARIGLKWPRYIRWASYYVIIFVILIFGGPQQPFIYFQF